MPAATTYSYHVAGPIIPQCNIGSAQAFVGIGQAQDGAEISITPTNHGIKSDGGGGLDGQPVEYIFLNAIAVVRFKLVPFAGTYVNTLRAMSVASTTDGQLPVPGTLYGGGTFLPALYLPAGAGETDGPWLFNNCLVVRPGDPRQWVKETTPEFEFRAMVYLPPTTASVSGLPLYTRAAPS